MTIAIWVLAIGVYLNGIAMIVMNGLGAKYARRRIELEAKLKSQENDRENAYLDRVRLIQAKIQYEANEINARLELARMTNSEELMKECLLNFAELKAKYENEPGVKVMVGGPAS